MALQLECESESLKPLKKRKKETQATSPFSHKGTESLRGHPDQQETSILYGR